MLNIMLRVRKQVIFHLLCFCHTYFLIHSIFVLHYTALFLPLQLAVQVMNVMTTQICISVCILKSFWSKYSSFTHKILAPFFFLLSPL